MKSTRDLPVDVELGAAPARKDAIGLLCFDHALLLRDFAAVLRLPRDADLSSQAASIGKITASLKLHLEIENTIFYPAAVARGGESVEIESSFEQDDEQYIIEQLEALSPADPRHDEKLAGLFEQFKEHVLEEETEIFPRLRAARIDMDALAVKIRRRQRCLA